MIPQNQRRTPVAILPPMDDPSAPEWEQDNQADMLKEVMEATEKEKLQRVQNYGFEEVEVGPREAAISIARLVSDTKALCWVEGDAFMCQKRTTSKEGKHLLKCYRIEFGPVSRKTVELMS